MSENPALEYHTHHSSMTHPGEYTQMYHGLPESLSELCCLIKKQFIHPAILEEYPDVLPKGSENEDTKFLTVEQMLETLLERNPLGLVINRPPEERVLVSCRYHVLLLISIMKYRGIPARARVGFAPYLNAERKPSCHWIAEIWNPQEHRWLFVDPDIKRVDFPRQEFDLAGSVWLKARKGTIQPELYGLGEWRGLDCIRGELCQDFASILGFEPVYWDGPPLYHMKMATISLSFLGLLDTIAHLLQDPDCHLDQLITLRQTHQALQVSKC